MDKHKNLAAIPWGANIWPIVIWGFIRVGRLDTPECL